MTQLEIPDPNELAADMPPGTAPTFGIVPQLPFEATPEHLVLSSEAHSHLSATVPAYTIGGHFSNARLGDGSVSVRTISPGEVHIHADVLTAEGPAVHLDADVRETWLNRAARGRDSASANVQVVSELIRLAQLPSQKTVKMRVDSRHP